MALREYSVQPLPGNFGVAVEGLDLREAAAERFPTSLFDLLYEHHIIVIRGQKLSTAQYMDFGRRWGVPVPFFQTRWTLQDWPDILLVTNEAVPGKALPPAEAWHSDGTYLAQPHSTTMLYGQEAPRDGGETYFANIGAAYEALPQASRELVDKLTVKHKKNGGLRLAADDEKALELTTQTTKEEREKVFPVEHPLVIRHPVTGRKVLYCSTTSAYGIEGMEEDDAVDLLLKLKAHALQKQFRQSYKTLPGDILIWDNYSVIHKAGPVALSNEEGERRKLHRITVNGLPPEIQARLESESKQPECA